MYLELFKKIEDKTELKQIDNLSVGFSTKGMQTDDKIAFIKSIAMYIKDWELSLIFEKVTEDDFKLNFIGGNRKECNIYIASVVIAI